VAYKKILTIYTQDLRFVTIGMRILTKKMNLLELVKGEFKKE
jgi:hypothetical protein